MSSRNVVLVTMTNNPSSEPPLSLSMTNPFSKITRATVLAGVFLVAAGGTPNYTYAETGLSGTGLSLNTSTGEITGTPTNQGHISFEATVTDAAANSVSANFSIDVISQLDFESPGPPAAENGWPYSYQYSVAGATGAVSYAVTLGSVPAGMTLTSGGLLSSANVTETAGDTVNFTVTATDAGTGDTLDIPCSVYVWLKLRGTGGAARPVFVVGVPYTLSQAGMGYVGGAPNYKIKLNVGYTLPAGLSFTPSPTTGEGVFLATAPFTPTAVRFDVTDSLGHQVTSSTTTISAVVSSPSADAGNAIGIGTDGALYAPGGGGGGSSISEGPYGSRPAAGTMGRLYLATDLPVASFDTGSAWDEYWKGWKVPKLSALIASRTPQSYYQCNDTGSTLADSGSAAIPLTVQSGATVAYAQHVPTDDVAYLAPNNGGGTPFGAFAAGNPAGLATYSGSWSAEAIVFMTGTTAGGPYNTVFCIETQSGSSFQVFFGLSNNNIAVGWSNSGGSFFPTVSASAVILPMFRYHIGVAKDAAAKKVAFYLNGCLNSVVSYSTECSVSNSTLYTRIGDTNATNQAASPFSLLGHIAFYYGQVLAAADFANSAKSAGLFAA